MRFAAFFKIYQILKLNFLKFDKILQILRHLQFFAKFQKFQLENLVDFEKCCKAHILLQKSEPIQPKTSNILPKFCQPTLSDVSGVVFGQGAEGVVPQVQALEGRVDLGRSRGSNCKVSNSLQI